MVCTNGRISFPPPPPDWNLFCCSDPRRAFACKSGCITVNSLTLPELSICIWKPSNWTSSFIKSYAHAEKITPTQRSFDSAPLSVWTWPLVVRGHPVYRLPGFRCQRHTWVLCSNPLVFTVHSKKIKKYPFDKLALEALGFDHLRYKSQSLSVEKKKEKKPRTQISDSSTALIQLVRRIKSPYCCVHSQ